MIHPLFRNFFCLSSRDPKPESFFVGHAFTKYSFIEGIEGLREYQKTHGTLSQHVTGGRFSLVEVEGDSVTIQVDPSGQDLLFLYMSGSDWIVGNSLLLVARKLKEIGVPRNLCQEAVSIFRTGRQSLNGGQLVSKKTPITGVVSVPAKAILSIDYSDRLLPVLSTREYPTRPSFDRYGDALREFISESLARLEAIMRTPGKGADLALSGGVDSRACLALLASGVIDKNRIRAFSNHSRKFEAGLANRLADYVGVEFGRTPRREDRSYISDPYAALDLGLIGCAGTYALLAPVWAVSEGQNVRLHGGSVIGSGYMRSSLINKSSKLIKVYGEDGRNVAAEIKSGLLDASITADDPKALFHHYYNYRARFHYGRAAYTRFRMNYYMPLFDDGLLGVCECSDKDYIQGNGVTRDIISSVNASLLEFPFDAPDKIQAPARSVDPFVASGSKMLEVYSASSQAGSVSSSLLATSKDGEADGKKLVAEELIDTINRNVQFYREAGFDASYIEDAKNEVLGGGTYVKSGVLVGLSALFE